MDRGAWQPTLHDPMEHTTRIYAETTPPRVGALTQSRILLKTTNYTSVLCVEV